MQQNLTFYGIPHFRILRLPGVHDVSKCCMKKMDVSDCRVREVVETKDIYDYGGKSL